MKKALNFVLSELCLLMCNVGIWFAGIFGYYAVIDITMSNREFIWIWGIASTLITGILLAATAKTGE